MHSFALWTHGSEFAHIEGALRTCNRLGGVKVHFGVWDKYCGSTGILVGHLAQGGRPVLMYFEVVVIDSSVVSSSVLFITVAPDGVVVFVHPLYVLASSIRPSPDALDKYHTLHVAVSLVRNIIGEPSSSPWPTTVRGPYQS